MSKQFALSTIDNPFNPFEQFNEWFQFDCEKGYYSCSKLDRLAEVQDDFTQKETNEAVERAIDEIIKNDILNVFVKVSKDIKDES